MINKVQARIAHLKEVLSIIDKTVADIEADYEKAWQNNNIAFVHSCHANKMRLIGTSTAIADELKFLASLLEEN